MEEIKETWQVKAMWYPGLENEMEKYISGGGKDSEIYK